MYYISVNKYVILHNVRHGTDDPPIRVAWGKHGKPGYAKEVKILGPARMVYAPEHPLKCGARLWLETEAKLEIVR